MISSAPALQPSATAALPPDLNESKSNKYEYFCFDLTTSYFQAVGSCECSCKSFAAKISLIAFPIITALAVLEAFFDILVAPITFLANCCTKDDQPKQPHTTPLPLLPTPTLPNTADLAFSADSKKPESPSLIPMPFNAAMQITAAIAAVLNRGALDVSPGDRKSEPERPSSIPMPFIAAVPNTADLVVSAEGKEHEGTSIPTPLITAVPNTADLAVSTEGKEHERAAVLNTADLAVSTEGKEPERAAVLNTAAIAVSAEGKEHEGTSIPTPLITAVPNTADLAVSTEGKEPERAAVPNTADLAVSTEGKEPERAAVLNTAAIAVSAEGKEPERAAVPNTADLAVSAEGKEPEGTSIPSSFIAALPNTAALTIPADGKEPGLETLSNRTTLNSIGHKQEMELNTTDELNLSDKPENKTDSEPTPVIITSKSDTNNDRDLGNDIVKLVKNLVGKE